MNRKRSTVICLLLALVIAACESLMGAEFDDLHVRVFTPCEARLNDDARPDEACTKAEGRDMACFAASQLGGEDYCVEYCDPRNPPEDMEGFSCFASGALLQNCDPNDAGTCPAGLSCFRTDIAAVGGFYPPQAKGICARVPTCTDHADCTGTHNICGGELLRQLFPQSFATNGLHCIQPCPAPDHQCPEGESCLSKLIVFAEASDICVPNCDVKPCPPGYFCLANAGKGYPFGCATGFPGTKCSAPEDCMLGNCVAVDPALSVCTIDCDTDGVCDVLPPVQGRFLCVNNHCVDKQTHLGIRCLSGDDACPDGQHCSDYDPYAPDVPREAEERECRSFCKSDGTCEPIGGMPRVCLPNGECYPGDMGLPCKNSSECMGEFSCECVENCDTPETATRICTKQCASDDECVGYDRREPPDRCVDGLCQLRPR